MRKIAQKVEEIQTKLESDQNETNCKAQMHWLDQPLEKFDELETK